jgi:hypothetical membrane protein
MRRLQRLREKYPLLGPWLWVAGVQYFVVQVVVAAAWNQPYSWRLNTISDIGNSACALYGHEFVCSPLHGFMNASFVLLGICVLAGSLLNISSRDRSKGANIGFLLMGIGGVGTVLVGLAPENTVAALHVAGATLPFVLGNIALIVLGKELRLPLFFKWLTVGIGFVCMIALVLFLRNVTLGLGHGGMERIVAYPQTVWMITYGFCALARRSRSQRHVPNAI